MCESKERDDNDEKEKKTDENTKRIKRASRLIRPESEIKIGFLAEWSGGPGNDADWYCLQNETKEEEEEEKTLPK